MILRVLLIAGSLALNGVCLTLFALRPTIAPAPVRDFFARHFKHQPPAAVMAKPTAASPAKRKQLWPQLDAGGDLKTLAARLRSAGFPPEIVRAMVLTELSARYDARLRSFFEPDPNAPFWKQGSTFLSSNDKRMEQYSALQRERTKLQRELLADPFFATDDVSAAQRRQFGNLSRPTIDQLQRIEDDYAEMGAAIRSATNGIILADDREKLALLQRERHADLASVLTPQELADYEMRSSPITNLLARQISTFNASESEFRAIFQAQQAFSDRISPSMIGGGDYAARQAAQQQLNDQLKTALGPERYADYVRETDRNYQALTRLAQRENIPPETTVRAFNVRETVAQDSGRIADDTTLSLEQKRAALKELADRTRTQLLGILGPNAGPTYVQMVDQQWLKVVERGNAVSFNGSSGSMTSFSMGSGSGLPVSVTFGSSPSYRSINQPPPPAPRQ